MYFVYLCLKRVMVDSNSDADSIIWNILIVLWG